tara:strand:- start:1011 stop:1868 length:858 start_codon:yes stop_codon:yes gene_type:complete
MSKIVIYIEQKRATAVKKSIIYDGLLTNENITISEDIDTCDYILINDDDILNKNIEYKEEYCNKIIILDYNDNSKKIYNQKCLRYFKRSVVDKKTMKILDYNREVIPISYCLKKEMAKFENIYDYDRTIDISVMFNLNRPGCRGKVANFVNDNFSNYNIHVGNVGRRGTVGRNSIQKAYFEKMFESKIVVTCNPSNWEGDWRTWDSLSSGALVFVDIMMTPIKNPLIDKKHVIFYNRKNLSELKEKLIFYLKNPDLCKSIAKEGCEYARKYHKPSNRIDEILSHL